MQSHDCLFAIAIAIATITTAIAIAIATIISTVKATIATITNRNNSNSNRAVLEKLNQFVDRFPISNQSAETVL